MLLLSIMMVLLAVSLDAGNAALRQSHLSIEWSKSLTVAEAGVNQSVTLLGQSRGATNPCRISTSTVCSGGGGQYQVSWSTSGGTVLISSIGYFPDEGESDVHARGAGDLRAGAVVQVRDLSRRPPWRSPNNMTVIGDVYSAGDVTLGNGA